MGICIFWEGLLLISQWDWLYRFPQLSGPTQEGKSRDPLCGCWPITRFCVASQLLQWIPFFFLFFFPLSLHCHFKWFLFLISLFSSSKRLFLPRRSAIAPDLCQTAAISTEAEWASSSFRRALPFPCIWPHSDPYEQRLVVLFPHLRPSQFRVCILCTEYRCVSQFRPGISNILCRPLYRPRHIHCRSGSRP